MFFSFPDILFFRVFPPLSSIFIKCRLFLGYVPLTPAGHNFFLAHSPSLTQLPSWKFCRAKLLFQYPSFSLKSGSPGSVIRLGVSPPVKMVPPAYLEVVGGTPRLLVGCCWCLHSRDRILELFQLEKELEDVWVQTPSVIWLRSLEFGHSQWVMPVWPAEEQIHHLTHTHYPFQMLPDGNQPQRHPISQNHYGWWELSPTRFHPSAAGTLLSATLHTLHQGRDASGKSGAWLP